MNSTRRLIPLILPALLAACAAPALQKPDLSVSDIRTGKIGLFEQQLDVGLNIRNPNPVALSATGLQFDLDLAGDPVASGTSTEAISIPASGETTIRLSVRANLLGWSLQHKDALAGGRIDYRLRGKLDGVQGFGTVPFDRKGQWQLPAIIKLGN